MPTYSYDPTGILPANRIINEQHTIDTANGVDSQLLLPIFAPFFGESMVVVDPAGTVLTLGEDYVLTHHWGQATTATGKPVFGTITLLPSATGVRRLTYQTIGGEFADTKANSIESGLVDLNRIITIDWSGQATAFPTTRHNHDTSGLIGMSEILNKLDALATAFQNPHTTIQMGNIDDFDEEFITPVKTKLNELVLALNNRPVKVINYDGKIRDLETRVAALEAAGSGT